MPHAEFDDYVRNYDRVMTESLSATGEDRFFFVRGRCIWVRQYLATMRKAADTMLDFGCGTGSSTPFLKQLTGIPHIHGIDISTKSIDDARRNAAAEGITFSYLNEFESSEKFDAAFTNGVFLFIPCADRSQALRLVWQALKPGGLFFFFENNPWNPGSRYLMSRNPLDKNANPITPGLARSLLSEAGFEIAASSSLFFFPRVLGFLRWLEPMLGKSVLGGQYVIVAEKPSTPRD